MLSIQIDKYESINWAISAAFAQDVQGHSSRRKQQISVLIKNNCFTCHVYSNSTCFEGLDYVTCTLENSPSEATKFKNKLNNISAEIELD